MNIAVNSNFALRQAVNRKWKLDEQKEWWYGKLAEARRTKLLRCSEQQNHRCCYCNVRTWHPSYGETGPKRLVATLEHVLTRREGGTDHMHNLTMACSGCNSKRGDRYDAVEFYEIVVGLRPMPKVTKVVDQELMRKKAADKVVRTNRLLLETAALLTQLNLWEWWDSWLTFSLPMLDYE